MSFHFSWTDYTAKRSGQAVKEVTCHACSAEYLYVIERSAVGQATTIYRIDEQGASERSEIRAQEKLHRYLQDDFDLVPCPNCGNYQPQMIAFLRRAHNIWMFLLASLLFLLAVATWLIVGLIFLSSHPPYDAPLGGIALGAVVMVVVGVGLILTRNSLAAKYDPNAGDPEERKSIAQSRSILKKDLPRR